MRANVLQFGSFELDPGQQELRRRGVRLRLPPSRFRLLLLLVTRSGDLVTREEIAACLWKDTQNIDIMSGINTAVNQLRAQLGDDPAAPRYIETVIGAGYRFTASVVEVAVPEKTGPETDPKPQATAQEEMSPSSPAAAEITEASAAGLNPVTLRRRTALAVAAVLVITAPILFYVLQAATSRRAVPRADLQLARVTGSGDIQVAGISPDGKYVAYVRETGGRQTLWLKQLATGRLLELAAIGEYQCPGVAFSPDGNYVYFVRQKPLEPGGELYQVPFLGGSPVKVLEGISGEPAISPDGRRVAFVRSTLVTHGEDSLVVAALDGSGERVLASYKAPGIHLNRITWTADGRTLVYPVQSGLMAIPAEGGAAHPVPGGQWAGIDDLWGLGPGRDLVVVAQLSDTSPPQIFMVSLDGGTIRPITHDLSHYIEVRSTADGDALLAVQDVVLSAIQVLRPGAEAEAKPLSAENENRDGVEGLAWTPQGQIVFRSDSDQRRNLMEIDADGSNSRRLVAGDPQVDFTDPAVSPHGDFIAVARWSENDEANIWRIDMAGGGEKRLTSGKQDSRPSVTPDGQWIVYSSIEGDQSVLMKVPSQGGDAIRLTDYNADSPSVSPDGKWIACSHIVQPNQSPSLTIVPIAGGPPAKVFQLPETASSPPLAWTPDGSAVAFIDNVNGVGNIREQPLAGGQATPVTHFTSGRIFNFQWSRDGRLAVSRGTEAIDAASIRNFRDTDH